MVVVVLWWWSVVVWYGDLVVVRCGVVSRWFCDVVVWCVVLWCYRAFWPYAADLHGVLWWFGGSACVGG